MPTFEEEQNALLQQMLIDHESSALEEARVQPIQQEQQVNETLPQQQEVSPQPQPTQPVASSDPRQVAKDTEVGEKDRGVFTELGEWWSGQNPADIQDRWVGGINEFVQSLPDTPALDPLKRTMAEIDRLTLSKAEQDELKFAAVDKFLSSSDNPVVRTLGDSLKGQMSADLGIEQGMKIPVNTLTAITGQDDPWNNAPEFVKQSPQGESIFNIAREVTPALVLSAAPISLGGKVTTELAEAGAETIGIRNADDTMTARFLAGELGVYAKGQGLNGDALAKELVEGTSGRAQLFIKTLGFLENAGLNLSMLGFGKAVGKGWKGLSNARKAMAGNADDAAKVLDKPVDDVLDEIENVNSPEYRADYEPSDVLTPMSAVTAPKPSKGNKWINDSALVADALRKNGLDADGLSEMDSRFFADLSKVSDDAGVQRVINEATRPLRRLKSFRAQKEIIVARAAEFWKENGWLAGEGAGISEAVETLKHHWKQDLTKLTEEGEVIQVLTEGTRKSDDALLRDWTELNETGAIVTPLILEKLGVQAQKLARGATNLDAIGVDFMPTVEQFVDLHSQIQTFAVPLRRTQRRWSLMGNALQRQTRKIVEKGRELVGKSSPDSKLDVDSDFESFTSIHRDSTDVGATLQDLLWRYKNGDIEAGKTLKQYMSIVAYGNPRTASTQIVNMATALSDQLKKGNTAARSTLYYAAMLTNLGTQVVSSVSGVIRLITDPVGAALSGEKSYALGQVAGMWSAKDEIWGTMRRSWVQGRSITGGSKVDIDLKDLKKLQLEQESAYQGLQKQMNESGAGFMAQMGAFWNHNTRMFALHPYNNFAARALTATDDGLKVLYAAGIGTGLAWKEAAEIGYKRGSKQFDLTVKRHMDDVFIDGIKKGEINPDYLPALKNVTFQSDIPSNGNFIDNAYSGLEDLSKDSALFKVMMPFPKVSYNALEATARYEPTGLLRGTVPRYKAILAGEQGEVMALQLKSQIAFGRYFTATGAALAAMGLVTGYNEEELPKTSFIIPKPGGGYFAFDYSRFPPFSSILAVTADFVSGVKNEVISEGQYGQFINNMVYSIGMSSFDQSFLFGMMNFTSLMDVKNMSENRAVSGGKMLAGIAASQIPYYGGATQGVLRQVGRALQPSEVITRDESNPFASFWNAMIKQQYGGVGLPVMYNQYTGEPISRTNISKSDNAWWVQAGARLLGQIAPGYTRTNDTPQVIIDEFDFLNYQPDEGASVRRYRNVALTPTEQSILSRDIAKVGNLSIKLQDYFKSKRYQQLKNQLKQLRVSEDMLAQVKEGSRADMLIKAIHGDINAIRNQSKDEAVRKGELGRNETGLMNRIIADNSPMAPLPQQQLNPLQSTVSELINIPK